MIADRRQRAGKVAQGEIEHLLRRTDTTFFCHFKILPLYLGIDQYYGTSQQWSGLLCWIWQSITCLTFITM